MADLTLGGHRIHCVWPNGRGEGRETVVFLHDGLGTTESWKDHPQRLAEAHGLNALAYDRWGYGKSEPRPDFPFAFLEAELPPLVQLLDRFRLGAVHLVGHSDGGSIALLLAALFPGRVRTAVTVGAHVSIEKKNLDGIRALAEAQAAGRTPAWLKKLHGRRAEKLLAAWSAGWLSGPHGKWNIEGYLHHIECPLLVVQGEQDDFGTPAQVEAIVSRVPGAESWLVPNCGHTAYNEQPEVFRERVGDFWGRHGVGAAGKAEGGGTTG